MNKKFLNKVRLKRKKVDEKPARITSDTIAEHREKILAGGRRFKYPVQVARHRLVITAILVAIGAVLLFIAFVWWQLFLVQASNDFIYRITRVLPIPVAQVDGQPVLYSDYLMKYRSSIHYLESKEQVTLTSQDGKRQAQHVKYEAMNDAIADAYATKLAHERNISISNGELSLFLAQQRQSPDGTISRTTYDAVILDYYGWTPQEYQQQTKNKLLRQKVSYAIDTTAKNLSTQATKLISGGTTDLKTVADTLNKSKSLVTYGVSGMVPKDNQDGGLAAAAAKLSTNSISGIITPTTGDGYYIVKPIASNTTQVNYEYIHIPLTEFDTELVALKKDGKVTQYIQTPDDTVTGSSTTTNTNGS